MWRERCAGLECLVFFISLWRPGAGGLANGKPRRRRHHGQFLQMKCFRIIVYSIYLHAGDIGVGFGAVLGCLSVHRHLSVENVFRRRGARAILLMAFVVLIFFREPRRGSAAQKPPTMAESARNFPPGSRISVFISFSF